MEFKRFLIQILFEKVSETSSQTENFLLLYVLGLLLHSDVSMQQLDIPVIIICKFFTKEYLSKISCVCHFSPFVFCMLFGIIKQIWHPCVVYNRNNSPSRGLSHEGLARGRQSSLGGVIPVVHHTGMSYLYNIYIYCKSLKYSVNNKIATIALCPYALL